MVKELGATAFGTQLTPIHLITHAYVHTFAHIMPYRRDIDGGDWKRVCGTRGVSWYLPLFQPPFAQMISTNVHLLFRGQCDRFDFRFLGSICNIFTHVHVYARSTRTCTCLLTRHLSLTRAPRRHKQDAVSKPSLRSVRAYSHLV
jgi:hypothetical protein